MQVQQKNNFGAKSAVPAFDLSSLNEERKKILKALRDDFDFKVSVILAAYSELDEDMTRMMYENGAWNMNMNSKMMTMLTYQQQ